MIKRIKIKLIKITLLVFCSLFITTAYGQSDAFSICVGESATLTKLSTPPGEPGPAGTEPWGSNSTCDFLNRTIEPNDASVESTGGRFVISPTETTSYIVSSQYVGAPGISCNPSAVVTDTISVFVEDCSTPDEVLTICQGGYTTINLNDLIFSDDCSTCTLDSFETINWFADGEIISNKAVLSISPIQTTFYIVELTGASNCDLNCEPVDALTSSTKRFTKVYQLELIDCPQQVEIPKTFTLCPGDTAIIPISHLPALPPIEIAVNEDCINLDRIVRPVWGRIIEDNRILLFPSETTEYSIISSWGPPEQSGGTCISSGELISNFLIEVIINCNQEPDSTTYTICQGESVIIYNEDLASPPEPIPGTNDCDNLLRLIEPSNGVQRNSAFYTLTPTTTTTYTIISEHSNFLSACTPSDKYVSVVEIIVEGCEPGNVGNVLDFVECPQDQIIAICAPVNIPTSMALQDFSSTDDPNYINAMSLQMEEQTDVHKYFNTTTRVYTISDESGNQKTCETKHHIANQFLQMPEVLESGVVCEAELWSSIKIGTDQYKIYADQNGSKGVVMSTCNTPSLICSTADLGVDTKVPDTYNFWASTYFEFPDGSICESEAMPFYVDVQAKPVAALSASNKKIQVGGGILLMDMVTSNKSGYWSGENISFLMTVTGENIAYFSANTAGVYKLYYTVKNDNCERSYLLVVEVDSAGKAALTNQSYKNINSLFTIYPNPTTNKIFIDLPYKADCKISLTDISGKVIKQLKTKMDERFIEMKVSDLPKGMYLIELKNEFNHHIQKLIVE